MLEEEALAGVGQARTQGLVCAVSMRDDDAPNAFGVKGGGWSALPHDGKPDRLGCGQHGGLSAWEQMPFLMIEGAGFAPGGRLREAAIVDLAPTILRHLGQSPAGLDGRALQGGAVSAEAMPAPRQS